MTKGRVSMANHTGVPQTPSGPHSSIDVEGGVQFLPTNGDATPLAPSAVGQNDHATEPKPTPTDQTPAAHEM
jgi:hypothetical protein